MQRSPPSNDFNPSKRPYAVFSSPKSHSSSNSLVNSTPVGNVPLSELDKIFQVSMAKLLDVKLKDVATKTDIEGISAEISTLKQNNTELKTQLNKMESRCVLLEKQVELLEKKANERNLVVHLKPTQANDAQNSVERAKAICLDLLQTTNQSKINAARQISSGGKTTNVIVEMSSTEDVFQILGAKTKLQDTGTTIHKDYPAAARERRRRLIKLRSHISARNNNIKSQIRGETLYLNEKKFYFDKNGKLVSDAEDGLFMIRQLTGDTYDLTALEDRNDYGGNQMQGDIRTSQTVESVHTRHF